MQQHRQHAELLSTPSAFCPRSLKMRAALVTVAGASDINRHLVPQLNVASLSSPSRPSPTASRASEEGAFALHIW